jgi:hypothetical protein
MIEASLTVNIDFDPLAEPWNSYKLEDDTLLRIRLIMIKIYFHGISPAGDPLLSGDSQNLAASTVKETLIGVPSAQVYTQAEIANAVTVEDMKIQTLSENWNEYSLKDVLTGMILYAKAIPVQISKTSLFNPRGEPVYKVNTQNVFKASPSKQVRESLLRRYGALIEKRPNLPHKPS